ncbi:MAG: quinone oxidoreductase family protein [Ramlibacter sp.]
MAIAIVQRSFGGPEVLQAQEMPVGNPGRGEVRIRQEAVGVNFHDVYVRTGLYRTLPLPGIPGLEAVGVVEDSGPEVHGLQRGDRVAYITRSYGAYASERLLPAALAVKVPQGLAADVVASHFLRALTAQMLVHQLARVQPGDRVLVHAAAGGVGRLVCRLASRQGATVIGTVGGPGKVELARAAGCAHVIDYAQAPVAERVRELLAGAGVQFAFDSVGRDTFEGSLQSLAPRGHLVVYGQSSGPIPPFDIARLMPGSHSITRASVFSYTAEPAVYRSMADATFAALADGTLAPEAPLAFPLADAAAAHAALESRARTRTVVLVP